jgi:hypothetical protein
MRFNLTIIALFIFTVCNAQKTESKYNIDEDCYSLEQQQTLNACIAEKAEELKKIVEEKYNCILNYLQKEIEECAKEKCDDLDYYKKHKNDLINSQETWQKKKRKNYIFLG